MRRFFIALVCGFLVQIPILYLAMASFGFSREGILALELVGFPYGFGFLITIGYIVVAWSGGPKLCRLCGKGVIVWSLFRFYHFLSGYETAGIIRLIIDSSDSLTPNFLVAVLYFTQNMLVIRRCLFLGAGKKAI